MFDTREKNRLFFIIVSILLFFSGAAGLIYEVIWTRILHYSFGGTQAAASTVLATFMGGMAIGAALGGKLAAKFDRPLLVYAVLQLFIAVFGLLFTPLLYHLDFIYNFTSPFVSRGILTTIRFFTGVIIMGAPTIAMGATLPVIARGFVSKGTSGRGVGILYFVNTLGAVLGTLLAGFIIIPGDGLDYGIKFAAGIGIFVASTSFFVQFRLKPRVMEEVTLPSEDKRPAVGLFYSDKILEWSPYLILAFAFFTGFISLSNEILWFKLLGILLDGTIYGFSALLASFLLGLSLGSLWISKKIDQKKDLWKLFVKLQIGAGIGAVVTIVLIPLIPFFASGYIAMGTRTPGSVFALKLFFVFCAILVPTFFYGASFPVLAKISNLSSSVSKAVGNVYSFNTLGCIFGAVLTGIFFIPWFKDLNLLLLILIYLSLIMAFLAVFLAGGREEARSIDTKLKLLAVVSVLLLTVTVLKPRVNIIRLVNSRYSIEDYKNSFGSRILTLFGNNTSKGKQLVFEAEGATTVVTVHKDKYNGYRLRNNGLNESYHSVQKPYYAAEIFYLGALPYLLHPNPERALLIGVGGGGTLDILASKQLKRIYAVELEKEVVKASRIMFGTRDHPLDRKNVDLLVDDGRNALLRMAKSNPASLDLVVSQPSHPWLSGASNLYTVEHFKIVSDNLKPGGIFCQWVNLFRMNEEGFRSLMKAFSTSFEHGHIFQVDDSSVFLLGSNRKFKLDGNIIKKHLQEKPYQEYGKDYGVDLNKILDSYLLDYEGISRIGKKGRMNSDRTPVIETVLPWVYHNTTFNLYSFFKKESIPSGLKPGIIANISAGELEKFFKSKLTKIDFLGKEKKALARQINDFKATIAGWEKFPGFDFNQIKSLYYEKIRDYPSAVKQILASDAIVKGNLVNLARVEWLNGNYLQSLFTNIILIAREDANFLGAVAGLLLNEIFQTKLVKIDFAPESDELKAHLVLAERLEKIFGSKWVFSFYGRLFEQLKQKTKIEDKKFWKVIAWSELQKSEPKQKFLQKYLDYGGSEHVLLKEILIFYSRARNREMIDELIEILKITEENIVEQWLVGTKLVALQLYSAAEGILEKVERKNRGKDEVEQFKLNQKLAEIKIRLGKFEQAQSYIDLMEEMKINAEDAKIIKETKNLLIETKAKSQ